MARLSRTGLVQGALLAVWVAGCARTGVVEPDSQGGILVDPSPQVPAPVVRPRMLDKGSREDAPGFVDWCASGGAPIVGLPVVDEQERVYVATSDGYVHAFERDGRFRWSYTVKGTPLGSVTLRPSDGAILMGTTGRFIYAINQNGGLRFRYPTLSPVWSGLLPLNPSSVVFLGHDTRLYALGNNGAKLYRVRAPGDPMGGPVVGRGDVVWLPLAGGVARFEAALKLERFPLPVAVEEVVVLGDGVVARGGGQAFFVSAGGEVTALGAAGLLAGDGDRALLLNPGQPMTMLNLKLERSTVFEGSATRTPSAAPTLVRDRLWVPQVDGSLTVHSLDGSEELVVQVGPGPLSTPVVGSSGRWAVVSEPGGEFCAVQLRAESAE